LSRRECRANISAVPRLALVALLALACLTACGSAGGDGGSGSPENGPILVAKFGGLGGIFRRDVDGSLHSLTTNERDSFPTWSPDGRLIAFERLFGDQGASHLFVMDRDGGNVHQIGDVVTFSEQLAWSPDSKELLFAGEDGFRTVGVDGSGERVLLRDQHGLAHRPAWSPDGETIAFVRTGVGLVTVDADGGKERVLVRLRPLDDKHFEQFFAPAWSPDGKEVAFLRSDLAQLTAEKGNPTSLEVVNKAGGDPRVITDVGTFAASADIVHPAWSPDGTSIAFADTRGDTDGIWVVSSGGGKPRLLLEGDQYSMPSWGSAGT